ncbi:hypothetical protein J1N35_003367 [Gossypium stocksii]|uniref:Uncharacterized protein n=1 Tax=Gossypium stocksii TaxID=47602 RepID=A0A9D4AQ95_9ROSI|nr:hypothetical protein J1N35_003367 [Gossypium stocksii]
MARTYTCPPFYKYFFKHQGYKRKSKTHYPNSTQVYPFNNCYKLKVGDGNQFFTPMIKTARITAKGYIVASKAAAIASTKCKFNNNNNMLMKPSLFHLVLEAVAQIIYIKHAKLFIIYQVK